MDSQSTKLFFTPLPEIGGCHFIEGSGPLQGERCNMPCAAGSNYCRNCLKIPDIEKVMEHRQKEQTQLFYAQNVSNMINKCERKIEPNVPTIKVSIMKDLEL